MFDAASWAALARAEWTAIAAAPFNFVGALLVGLLIGWIAIRAWYRRAIENGKDAIQSGKDYAALIKRELEIERRQKEGLRKALLEVKPEAKPLAVEVAYGDPKIQEVVKWLGQGQTISTTINPTMPVVVLRPISAEEIKNNAVGLYISANGLSQVTSVQPGGITVSSSTSLGQEVADYLTQEEVTKKSG
jgi:hypothetical protein